MSVWWNDGWLRAKVMGAVRPAAAKWAAITASRSPSSRVARSVRLVAGAGGAVVGFSDPLAVWFEFGTRPHDIAPKGQALKFPDGGFVSKPVDHPGMKSEPFIRPMLPLWPTLYRASARFGLV